jgi:hypothetical protein
MMNIPFLMTWNRYARPRNRFPAHSTGTWANQREPQVHNCTNRADVFITSTAPRQEKKKWCLETQEINNSVLRYASRVHCEMNGSLFSRWLLAELPDACDASISHSAGGYFTYFHTLDRISRKRSHKDFLACLPLGLKNMHSYYISQLCEVSQLGKKTALRYNRWIQICVDDLSQQFPGEQAAPAEGISDCLHSIWDQEDSQFLWQLR